MLNAVLSYNMAECRPVYDKGSAACHNVALQAGARIRAGTVMGLVPNAGAAVDEVQRLTVTGTPTGGTITLLYGSSIVIGPFAYNASVATIQAAVDAAFGTTGSGNRFFTVSGAGALPGNTIDFTAANEAKGMSHALMTVSHTFTGGTTPAAAVTRQTAGMPVGGYWAPYVDTSVDPARGILRFDCAVDITGNITNGQQDMGGYGGAANRAAPVYYKGYFRCRDLLGLDANGVTDMGKLINASSISVSTAILCLVGA